MPTRSVSGPQPVVPVSDPSGIRTLFIVLDAGTAIRNILRTDVFTVLKNTPGLRIVIFSPLHDEAFRAEFECENVFCELLPHSKTGALVGVLRSLRKDIWAETTRLYTFGSKRQGKGGRFFRRPLLSLLTGGFQPTRSQAVMNRIEQLEQRLMPRMAKEYFEKYRPSLVFYATLYAKTHCLEVGALQHKVPSASFILSWDNPTSKGPFPVRPDHVVLWNEVLRDELLRYHGFRPDQLHVTGVPQFDLYHDRSPLLDREAFFKKWGLDPAKKLVTYTTGTNGTSPFDHEVVDLLFAALKRGELGHPAQLLVRLHPKDRQSDYTRFENQPGLILQLPGRRANTADSWNPTREDMFGLAELMLHSDVVVNVASTITIDAAAFDTPVVNVAFDGYRTKPFDQSCQRYYRYEHYQRIVDSGGVKISRSIEELVRDTRSYLDDPSQEKEGRARIRREQCWKLDGQSGRRIAEKLIELMGPA